MKKIRSNSISTKSASHSGQSMLEVAVALPFLLLIVIGIIEFGIVFASYVSLVNAAREGAVFASMYPALADTTCGATPNPTCTGPNDDQAFGTGTTIWDEYVKRVNDEVVVVVGEPLKAGQLLDQDILTVQRPTLGPTTSSCPTRKEAGCPITVTVHYRLHTLTSDMSLPAPRVKSNVPPAATWTQWFFNIIGNVDWSTGWRMGLPNYYEIVYSFGMPIR